ncbi:MAG: hypothetical protein JSR58_07480 [Verrucomicrobia bacterium]|nr:hypothetical protein [Verrucomicrobiota bacterium]
MRTFFDPLNIRPKPVFFEGFSRARAIKFTLRTVVAGGGLWAAFKTREFKMFTALGAVTFAPSVLLGAGGWIAYTGSAQIINSIAALTLKGLGLGVAKVGGGYLCIAYHDLPEEILGIGGTHDLIIIDTLSEIFK